MTLFALECGDAVNRRSLEAVVLSARLPVAKSDEPGVSHVLIDCPALEESRQRAYPNAKIVVIDMAQLKDVPARLRALAKTIPKETPQELIGTSPQIVSVRKTIELVATSDVTVLITGETGCGKECAVRMVHRLSRRNTMPLVALNCAAIPDTMLEGELFGYEKGAFTGAIKAYPGKMKLADGGTLALDEIGDLSPQGQAKILRAIETHEFYRIGGVRPEHFNARIVAMTNVDLVSASLNNTFRKDLYYRLAVAQVHLPPLRERREDILPLARHFLSKSPCEIADDAADALQSYNWPGNVRELGNVMALAALAGGGGPIRIKELPAQFHVETRQAGSKNGPSEKERLLAALKAAGGNKSVAAKALNWSRMTLYRKLEQHLVPVSVSAVTDSVTL